MTEKMERMIGGENSKRNRERNRESQEREIRSKDKKWEEGKNDGEGRNVEEKGSNKMYVK